MNMRHNTRLPHLQLLFQRYGGRTVVAAPPAVGSVLSGLADRLRLRPHLCRGVTVWAAAGKTLHHERGLSIRAPSTRLKSGHVKSV